ncbi:hypothetical protein BDV3_003774 [Batrachochytrium dendrobatidis]
MDSSHSGCSKAALLSDPFASPLTASAVGSSAYSMPDAPALPVDSYALPVDSYAPPPSYDTALQETLSGSAGPSTLYPTAPSIPPSLPPDYFDVSIIPTGSVLYPQNCPALGAYSDAEIIQSSSSMNIESHDSKLDKNPDELWRFFMSNLQNPRLMVDIHGYHTETKYIEEVRDGESRTTSRQEDVSDFRIKIDVTRLMSTYWSRIVCVPDKNASPRNLRETLEDYTRSDHIWKEIHLTKQPLWDFNELSCALEFAVRQTGYMHKIKISFPQKAAKVSVYSSHTLSRLSRSTFVWVICILSCLWIIVLPIYLLMRKKVSTKIVCEFPMMVSGHDFYMRHYYTIQNMAKSRSFKTIQAI